jgi:hypothetical protein
MDTVPDRIERYRRFTYTGIGMYAEARCVGTLTLLRSREAEAQTAMCERSAASTRYLCRRSSAASLSRSGTVPAPRTSAWLIGSRGRHAWTPECVFVCL